MRIKFCGAAESVTGSCHLIVTDQYKILLDCGLFQGGDEAETLNEDFPFDPEEIDFVLLSHAHIDHSGRIPLLVKRGFRGKIYCTDSTADLLDIMLRDSGYIHEKEAEWKNKKNLRTGNPLIEPLYTVKDAEIALKYVTPVLYDQLLVLNDKIRAVFNDAGHVLGSAIIEVFAEEDDDIYKLVFSGDLGLKGKSILRDPTIIKKADYLVMETTYGDRVHAPNADCIDNLIDVIMRTTCKGGTVIIPSFAVGRTQDLIFQFNRFYEDHAEYRKALDKIKVYVDSPMATSATEVFRRNAHAFDDEFKSYVMQGDNPLDFKNLVFTRTVEESKALNMDASPKIIISASGMCEAGRIKHHLKHNLWNPLSSVVFVGYQAEGTLGRSIVNGDKNVSIFGERIHVQAKIYNFEGFSGHADREGLLEWLAGFERKPCEIFLVHGEATSKINFAKSVKNALGYDCTVVKEVSEYTLPKKHCVEEDKEGIAMAESIGKIKKTITEIHGNLENVLYNAKLAVGSDISAERLVNINNIVQELYKSSVNLGQALTKK